MLLSIQAAAEQSIPAGDYEVHYSIVNSTFLQPEVATQYEIARSPERAIISLSILDSAGQAQKPKIEGLYVNLLSQQIKLDFKSISEGPAHYYVATFRHTDQELLKFKIVLTFEDEESHTLEFEQKVYVL